MPTDYRDSNSERKFSIVCSKLANAVAESQKQGPNAIVTGDMNGNLSDTKSSRTEIPLSSYTIVGLHPTLTLSSQQN